MTEDEGAIDYANEYAEANDLGPTRGRASPAAQAADAFKEMNRPEEDWLHLPWPTLDKMMGGIPKGSMTYVGAFSGDGKTTFLVSLTAALMESGRRVYYVPTETPAKNIRIMVACAQLGLYAGDILSGRWRTLDNAADIKESVRANLYQQATQGLLYLPDSSFVTTASVYDYGRDAASRRADIFILDHVDHVELAGKAGRSQFDTNAAINAELHYATSQWGLRTFAASQFNLEAVRGYRTMRYLPPRENYLYMGNKKRHLAHYMLGVYRPLKLRGLDADLVRRFNDGDSAVTPSDILEPGVMAVSLMKHRIYGGREGQRIFLPVHHGRVVDDEKANEAAQHGIMTARPRLV